MGPKSEYIYIYPPDYCLICLFFSFIILSLFLSDDISNFLFKIRILILPMVLTSLEKILGRKLPLDWKQPNGCICRPTELLLYTDNFSDLLTQTNGCDNTPCENV